MKNSGDNFRLEREGRGFAGVSLLLFVLVASVVQGNLLLFGYRGLAFYWNGVGKDIGRRVVKDIGVVLRGYVQQRSRWRFLYIRYHIQVFGFNAGEFNEKLLGVGAYLRCTPSRYFLLY